MEYQLDGSPVVGGIGTWSLDKRHYYSAPPPAHLHAPPACAQESGRVWWALFNEAISNLSARGQWYSHTGQQTQSVHEDASSRWEPSVLGKELVENGPWVVGGGNDQIHFYRRGVAWTPWGGGTWQRSGARSVTLMLCVKHELSFDSDTHPTRFSYSGGGGGSGARDAHYLPAAARPADEQHPTLKRLLGHGPWLFGSSPLVGGAGPLSFLRGGVLVSPSGPGSYAQLPGSEDVEMTMGGDKYRLTTAGVVGCYQFKAVRMRDQLPQRGWVPMRHVSMEYTGWRDPWGCRM